VAPLGTHGELLTRVAAVDPASNLDPLSEGALSRVVRQAMTPAPRLWSRRRFRLASIGTLVGSGGLVLAGILGIEAASPGLPVLALGKIPQSSVEPQGLSVTYAPMVTAQPPFANYSFHSAAGLSSSSTPAIAYRLVSPVGAAAAASKLAITFGVRGRLVLLSTGAFRIAAHAGASITTWTSAGVVEWSYRTASATPNRLNANAKGALPNANQATNAALVLLSRLGVQAGVGLPTSARSPAGVEVAVPLVAGTALTDQADVLAYGVGSLVESAHGVFATEVAGPVYPTISASQAIGILSADHGFVFYGGIAPIESAGTPSPEGSDQAATGTHQYSSTGGFSAPSGPPAAIVVDIDHATLRYATYVLANGSSWLLPTWWLSGTEHGQGIEAGARYSAYVLAVVPRYVRLQSSSATP
jgi:hypothetical protein